VKTLFSVLSVLNAVACTLTLTLFLLFNRKPAKKETPEEDLIEKQQFKEHWIIMAFWLLGTIVVDGGEINVLWVVLFVVVGAYIASSSKSSAAAFQLAISRTQNPAKNPERDKANADVAVYCTNCATLQPVSARFCSACGASIAIPPFAQPSPLRHPMQGRIGNAADCAPTQSYALPDFGMHLRAIGSDQKTMLIYTSWEMDVLSVVDAGLFCTTRIQSHDGVLYCATFDFGIEVLSELLNASSQRTFEVISKSLLEEPSSTRNIRLPEAISVGVGAVLGEVKQGIQGPLIPLAIVEVFGHEHPSRAYNGTHSKP
jgi:hypothetical protein